MKLKKNIKVGKSKVNFFFFFIFFLFFYKSSYSQTIFKLHYDFEGIYTEIKVLDKVSSKNFLLKLRNGDELVYKNISIKSVKCKNSELDDNPEITAYIQVRDLNNKDNNQVFVFNGWMFSSSPSINPFDHPVYDIWLINCY
ncbi:MAG: hypothetical protein CK535_04825 [Pelagibacteraceae bacterium]|nr:MAG: hypothetical protein CK535_04825 [Pelagibacteraceae bacterium]